MNTCPLCDAQSHALFTVQLIIGSEELLQCNSCEFTYFAKPAWLAQSFKSRLTDPDVGVLDRNLVVGDFLSALIPRLGLADGTIVDWGAGYGILSRLMRDRGFDFLHHEEFAEPIFYSPRFEEGTCKADLLTLSEVALHFDNPKREFRTLAQISDRIFFTALVPPTNPSLDWWYLMPSTGLHVAFYPIKAMKKLADHLDMHLTTDGRFFHLLHREPLPLSARLLFRSRLVAFGAARVFQLVSDVRRALNRSKSFAPIDAEKVIRGE